ncbi:hypothetical protein TeGR_g3479 [Tetraparma gracilis]|uniref:Uncharacterized protein n=1 Tax=Tetraparma gracilis TaxID=2962635 RepID=A0ABQ6MY13_9STRA|nr:hypothetical protein TeGR_g3479 [Tetraparma gracilis]
MAYNQPNYDLSQFLDQLLFALTPSPSPSSSSPATKKLLVSLGNAYLSSLALAALESDASGRLTVEGILGAVHRDGGAVERGGEILRTREEMGRLLGGLNGVREVEEAEGEGGEE